MLYLAKPRGIGQPDRRILKRYKTPRI